MSDLTYTHNKENAQEIVEVREDGHLHGEIRAVSGWWIYFATGEKEGGHPHTSLQDCKDDLEQEYAEILE